LASWKNNGPTRRAIGGDMMRTINWKEIENGKLDGRCDAIESGFQSLDILDPESKTR
jgi:hypothetical protein